MQNLFSIILLCGISAICDWYAVHGQRDSPEILFPNWATGSNGDADAQNAQAGIPVGSAPPVSNPIGDQAKPPPVNENVQPPVAGVPPRQPGMPNGMDAAAILREHMLRQAAASGGKPPIPSEQNAPKMPPYSAFEALNQQAQQQGQPGQQQPGNEMDRRIFEAFHSDDMQRRLRDIEARYEREHGSQDSPRESFWFQAFSNLLGFGTPNSNGRSHSNEDSTQTHSDAQAFFFVPVMVAMVFAYFVYNCVKISSQWRDEQDHEESKKHKHSKRRGRDSSSDSETSLLGAGGLSSMLNPALMAALGAVTAEKKQEAPAEPAVATKPSQPQAAPAVATTDVSKLSFDELVALQQALLNETMKRQQTQTATASNEESTLRKRVVQTDGKAQSD